MEGALLPLVGDFLADMTLWLPMSLLLATAYVRTACAYRRHHAEQTGESVDLLTTLSQITHEVLALLGGGFFGVLCAYLGWDEYHKTRAFAGNVPLMTSLTVVGLGSFVVSLIRFGRHLRTDV